MAGAEVQYVAGCLLRLRHIRDAAREACRIIQGRAREDLEDDLQLVWALVKAVEIIGEAACLMDPASRGEIAGTSWEDVIGMRHHLVHSYFDINRDILWNTIREDWPPLITALEAFLPPGDA